MGLHRTAGVRVRFSFLGEPRDSLAAFTFNQNDMCLMFVAFATWAVRTSDLHTPDAWKTGLGGLGEEGLEPTGMRGTQTHRSLPGPRPSHS